MTTVKLEVQLNTETLLKAVEQLPSPELEQFVSQVVFLAAKRRSHSLPQVEAELLQNINQGITLSIQNRYNELIAKRQTETLTDEEYQELLALTETVEQRESQRLESLVKLAELKGLSLTELMKNLKIQQPNYV